MTNWLDSLIHATQDLESPERFYWWSGISLISAIVRKNVWLNRFSYTLYPNVYVLLISARSGLRKGVPVSWILGFLEKLECTRIITGRNSIQGVIKELSQQRTLENGLVLNDAQAFLCAPELNSFIVHDPEALTIMTDLHNTHEHEKEWKNTLKNSPVESLKNPCITFLGASNESLFEDLVTGKDIEGGFLARCFVVHESKRRTVNSLMFKPENLIDKSLLLEPLKQLIGLKGEFKICNPTRVLYDKWYRHLATIETTDNTGTIDRLGDQVLKLAMCVSLAYGPSLEITKEHLEIAISQAEEAYTGVKQVSSAKGKSELAPSVSKLLKILLDATDYRLERTRLLKKLWPDVDSQMFDRCIDTLGETAGSGAIKVFREVGTGKVMYELNESVVEHFKQLNKEIN